MLLNFYHPRILIYLSVDLAIEIIICIILRRDVCTGFCVLITP
nr:MAG TPA: hypothetical protein [Caudoviricetes sp.]